MRHPILFFLLMLPYTCFAQSGRADWQFSGGVSFHLGSVVKRGGALLRIHYIQNQVQTSWEGRIHYNFSSYGPPKPGVEAQLRMGMLYAFGEAGHQPTIYFNEPGINQTADKNALSYTFNAYFDQIGTSQTTGTIGLQFGHLLLLVENDILGKPGSDEFRTGSFLVGWQDSTFRLGLHSALWTGNPHTEQTKKYQNSDFARFGYKDISEGPYGKFSNGVLALSFEYALHYGQSARLQVGADAEQVRNIIQNRLMHDMYFWPEKWNAPKNFHLPMLDTEGEPYLYQAGQTIRPAKFYWETALNPVFFY